LRHRCVVVNDAVDEDEQHDCQYPRGKLRCCQPVQEARSCSGDGIAHRAPRLDRASIIPHALLLYDPANSDGIIAEEAVSGQQSAFRDQLKTNQNEKNRQVAKKNLSEFLGDLATWRFTCSFSFRGKLTAA
jgi:hypothetical protein